MSIKIRNINHNPEICLNVIREAFMTVAKDFALDKQNAPSNPAFIELEHLIQMKERGVAMFGAFIDDKCFGFVGIENAGNNAYYLEKLAVLPKYRKLGYGREIIDFVFRYVREHQGNIVSIGIIDEHHVLKSWYSDYGFIEVGKKKFDHLPFTVCFMEMEV